MTPTRVVSSRSVSEAPRGLGAGQRLTDAHELADMRQNALDHLDLAGPPAAPFNRVGQRPRRCASRPGRPGAR